MQTNHYRDKSIGNQVIALTAVVCLALLAIALGAAALWHVRPVDDPVAFVETVTEDAGQQIVNTVFEEGFSMVLPPGFAQESRQETAEGYVVYRFRSDEGYQFTFAIIPNQEGERFGRLPRNYSKALVTGVEELSQEVEGEILPVRTTVGGMPAALFRFYERETYRGVTFTNFLVVLDQGQKLVMSFSGKYGKLKDDAKDVSMPQPWYDSLMTFQRTGP